MDSPTPSQSSNEGRTLLATTTVAGHGLKHLYAAAFMIVLPEIKASLMLSNLAAGALVTARDVSAGVSTMPSGFLADRFSGKWAIILAISMAFIAFGYLAAGAVERYFAVAISIVLFGIGVSLWHPSALASLSARFPTRIGFAISLHGSGGSAGEILGPLIAGGLLLVLTWPQLFQISFIPAALAAVLVWFALRNLKGQQGVTSLKEYFATSGVLLKNRAFIAVIVLSGFRSLSNHIITTFVPIYLSEDLGFSSLEVGIYASLLNAIGIVTHPIMGYVSDKYGRKIALVPGMFFFGLLCIALAYASEGPQLILTIIAIGAVMFTFHHIFVAYAIDLSPPGVHGTSVALVYTGSMLFGGIGAILGGLLADKVSLPSTFIFAGVVVIAAALLLIFVPTHTKPNSAPVART